MKFWRIVKYALLGIAGMFIVGFVAEIALTAFGVLSTPTKIVRKITNPDNIIHQYEKFHALKARYIAVTKNITALKARYNENKNSENWTNLYAQQDSCREIVTEYNKNSIMTTTVHFKGTTLEPRLDINLCEKGS